MSDVIQKAISVNNVVQGAAVILGQGGVGDRHQDVNPTNTSAIDTNSVETKYTERFK